MAAIYSKGGNRWNILDFNFTKRDALSSVYEISMLIYLITEHITTLEGSVWSLSQPTLSTFPVGGNRSARRKPTTFGRALTDSFDMSVMSESAARIEPTIAEVKGALKGENWPIIYMTSI
jgi:hypothetical protein